MSSIVNPKAEGWDAVGGLFWTHGRKSARPSATEINLFLEDLPPSARVVIIGASTKELVEAAVRAGHHVLVVDFATKMLGDLSACLERNCVDVCLADITSEDSLPLNPDADAVLSDRLVNRFTSDEAVIAFSNMFKLCRPGGLVRTSVKLGLYEMDRRMLALAQAKGQLAEVWNPSTKTINLAMPGILEEALLPHGDIDREILMRWYRGRGRESRYQREDVLHLARRGFPMLEVVKIEPLPDAADTDQFVLGKPREG
jgi:hypothetical protein